MKRMWVLVLVGSVLSVGASAKDYGAGFKKFYSLGLPDVSEASYVKLEASGAVNDHSMVGYEVKLKGNAWLMDEVDAGESTFVYGTVRSLGVYDQKVLQTLRADEKKAAKEAGEDVSKGVSHHFGRDDQGRLGGSWKVVDLEKDIKTVLDYVEDEKNQSDRKYQLKRVQGPVFLFAAQAYRMGYTNEANRMAESLFKFAGDPRYVILAGLNHLADEMYEDVYADFKVSHDWTAYQQSVQALLKKFPSGWKRGKAVEMLNRNLIAHNSSDAQPDLEGEGVTEDDQEIMRRLSKGSNEKFYFSRYRENWLFPAKQQGWSRGNASPMDPVLERGVKAIPLLRVMLEDETMTGLAKEDLTGTHHTSYSSNESMSLTEEQIREQYNGMSRPATRADIAAHYLRQILISDNESRWQMSKMGKEELADEVDAFYSEFKDFDHAALAEMYLNEGGDHQKQAVAASLATGGDEHTGKLIESFVLQSENPMQHRSIVENYVMERGKEAGEFVQQYLETLRAAVDEESDEDELKKAQKSVDTVEKRLQNLVSAKSPEEMLQQVATGEGAFSEVQALLQQKLTRMDKGAAIHLVLSNAAAAVGIENTSQVLNAMNLLLYGNWYGNSPEQEGPPPQLADHADLWLHLLDLEKDMDEVQRAGHASQSLSMMVAWQIETLYRPEGADVQSSVSFLHQLGPRGLRFSVARARQKLNGEEPEDYPDAESIGASLSDGLVAKLKKAPAGDRVALLDATAAVELYALTKAVPEDEALKALLRPLANTVTQVVVRDQAVDQEKAIAEFKGKVLNKELIDQSVTFVRESLKEGVPLRLQVMRTLGLGGVVVQIWRKNDGEEDMWGNTSPSSKESSVLMGTLALPDNRRAQSEWVLDQGATASAPEAAGDSMDELLGDALDELDEEMDELAESDQEQFWELAKALDDPELDITQYVMLYLLAFPIEAIEDDDANKETEE